MKKHKSLILLGSFLLIATALVAAPEAPNAGYRPMLSILETVMWVMAGATLASGFFVLVRINHFVMRKELEDLQRAQGITPTPAVEKPSIWKRIGERLHKDVPLEEEKSILFEHEFDGIRELDNKLPSWWVWMFYLSMGIAVVYLTYYHILGIGDSSHERYAKQMERGEEQRAAYLKSVASLVNEDNAEPLTDASSLAAGRSIFQENCIACHGPEAQGAAVGPNLVDEYWLHGGGVKNIFKTVKYGVPTKGMIAWQSQLTPVKIHQVSSYIWSLQGTTPANAKAAEGEPYTPDAPSEEDTGELSDLE